MNLKKILILDDDRDLLEGIKGVLEDAGYSYIATDDSGTVQQKIRSYHPNIIILDVFLNEFRGENIAKKLKTSIDTKLIPIILISGSDRIKKLHQESKAETYLRKPFSGNELLEKIDSLTKNNYSFIV